MIYKGAYEKLHWILNEEDTSQMPIKKATMQQMFNRIMIPFPLLEIVKI